MKRWMKAAFVSALFLFALMMFPALATEADLSGTGWSYTGTVLTITANTSDYGLASSKSDWFIGTPFERNGIDHTVTEIIVEEGVTKIGELTFYGCSNLTKVTFPSTLKTIGSDAFMSCSKLKEVTIPASVTFLGQGAFSGCSSIEKITFEGEPPTIGTWDAYYDFNNTSSLDVFANCTADVYYRPYAAWTDSRIAAYSSGYQFYSTWHMVYDASGTCNSNVEWYLSGDTLILKGSGNPCGYSWTSPFAIHKDTIRRISVGSGITSISDFLFYDLPNVTYVSLPNTITALGDRCFYECNSLKSITLPASLTELGFGSFQYCRGLTSITLPAGIETIPEYCFDYCTSLANVTLPAGLKTIGDYAFCCDFALKSLTVPEGVETIGNKAFSSAGIEKITLPLSVTSIADNAFADVASLTIACHEDSFAAQYAEANSFATEIEAHTVTVLPAVEVTCTTDGLTEGSWCPVCETYFVEQEVIFAPGHAEIIDEVVEVTCMVPGKTEGKHCETCGEILIAQEEIPAPGHVEVTIEGIEPTCTEPGLKDYIFCETCGEELQLADELPALGHTETVTIEALEPTCTVPGHTEEISCSVCGEILTESETVPATGHWETVSEPAVEPDCVNTGLTEQIACLVCGEVLVEAEIIPALGHTPETDAAVAPTDYETGLTEGGHCTVCGEVLVAQEVVPANFTWNGNEATAYNGTATDVVVPEGTTALGNALFKSNTAITSVRVPDSVTAIGTQTFFGCTSLTDVWLPENLTSISAQAFYNVSAKIHVSAESATAVALSYRSIPFTTDDGYTLRYRVTSATGTPTAVWLVGWSGSGETLVLPEKVNGITLNQIQTRAFAGCGLKKVQIPVGVTTIAADAFAGCEETLTIVSAADAYARTWAGANGFAWEHDLHTEDVLAAVAPTCEETGLTEGLWCSGCEEIFTPQEEIAALGHTEVTDEAVAPTCESTGLTEGKHCSVCEKALVEQEIIDALGHTEVIDEAVAPTCTETGLTEGKHCSVCEKTLVEQEIVEALGHTEVIDEAVAPTCEDTGLTEGKHCSVCDKVLVEQEVVDALGHTEVIDEAVAPTCEDTGLTEGKHCSACDKILVEQTVVAALGHSEVTDEAVAPSCEETGLTEGKHCSVCDKVLVEQEVVDALGHTEVIDEAIAPSCEGTGLTEGKHCSVCDKVLVEQEIVDALGHTEVTDEAVAPTCESTGLTEGSHCETCGKVFAAQEIVAALGHTEVIDEAVAPTCTETGLTEGKHCSVCGEVLTAQEILSIKHNLDENCVCAGCGETLHDLKQFDYSMCVECLNCDYAFHRGFEGAGINLINITSFERYDYERHYATGTPVWIGHCADCGQICDSLVLDETRTMLQEHTYDESGICTGCGSQKHFFEGNVCICVYCGETEHDMCEDVCVRCGLTDKENHVHTFEAYIRNVNSIHVGYDDTLHLSTYSSEQISKCSICGYVDPSVDPVALADSMRYEKHCDEGDDGECDRCGCPMVQASICKHEITESNVYSWIYGGQTIEITDTYRRGIGYREKQVRCLLCGTNPISCEVLEENVEIILEHEYSSSHCSTCGYIPVCRHPSVSEKLTEFTSEVCYSMDAETHLVKGNGHYIVVCDECGNPASGDEEIIRYTELTQPHNFIPGTSICADCGYCPHGNTEVVHEAGTSVYKDITPVSHVKADVENVITICTDCGLTVSEEEQFSNAVQYVHTNLADGCECGYVCPHNKTHEEVRRWTDLELVGTTPYVHTYLRDATVSTYCDECNAEISSYVRRENYSEPHYFDEESGACSSCEYVNPSSECTHERMDFNTFYYEEQMWEETTGYTNVTEDGHTRIYRVEVDLYCPDCGSWEELIVAAEQEEEEEHYFYDGVCDCGYGTPTGTGEYEHSFDEGSCVCLICGETVHEEDWEDGHSFCAVCGELIHWTVNKELFESIDKYTFRNEQEHYVTGKAIVYEYCYECNLVTDETRHDAWTITEKHTFEHGRCTGCGYEGCAHANVIDCVCADCGDEVHSERYNCLCVSCGRMIHPDAEECFGMVNADYEPYDGSRHWAEGDARIYLYCESCEQEIPDSGKIIAEGVRELEYHHFVYRDGARTCTDCGYVWKYEDALCAHAHTELRRQEYVDWDKITEITETHEIGTGRIIEIEYCLDCSTVIGRKTIEDNVPVRQEHVFKVSDGGRPVCFNCGYMFTCLHEHVKWTPSKYYDGMYVKNDKDSHIFKGMAFMTGICEECGISVYDSGLDGATEAQYCEVVLPHTEVTDAAVPATHVTTGLTEGSHCSVCGEVIAAQQVIPVVDVPVMALPGALKVIDEEAFAGGVFACVVLPDGCLSIEAAAFADCAQLMFVEIPASVETIDDSAFDGCSDDLVIVTTAGSAAEAFARAHEITCVILAAE